MHLRRISLTPEQLSSLPVEDRRLFVLLGHVLNEVNTFDKLSYLSSLSYEGGGEWQDKASAAQTFILVRVLAGKLNEAWEALQAGYFGSKLSSYYQLHLTEAEKEALARLKQYFSRKNLLHLVRNQFAFHFDTGHAGTDVPADSTREDLSIYLHKRPGACLYYYADYLMNKALMDAISPADPTQALQLLVKELRTVIVDLNEFGLGVLHAVLEQRLGRKALENSGSLVNATGAPTARRKMLPYFIQLP